MTLTHKPRVIRHTFGLIQKKFESYLVGNVFDVQLTAGMAEAGGPGHCVFKWILRGHLKPTPNATI